MSTFKIEDYNLDDIDNQIILMTQKGLPICERPYFDISKKLNISEEEIVRRLSEMAQVGFIRKNAIATNHYKLGYLYNAMSVWNVDSDRLDKIGKIFQTHKFISHCYERPRIPPEWNYNLFAMVHGKSKEEVEDKIKIMKDSIENDFIEMSLIYSTKILKKTGIRLKED